jgi:hypothetical protein
LLRGVWEDGLQGQRRDFAPDLYIWNGRDQAATQQQADAKRQRGKTECKRVRHRDVKDP